MAVLNRFGAVLACAALASGSLAAETTPPVPFAAEFAACRAIDAAQDRLACFEKADAALDAAIQSGEVAIVYREDIKKTKRGLFGFGSSMAALFKPLLRGSSKSEDEDDLVRIDTVVTWVGAGRDGWRLTFAEGGTWEQTDTKNFVMSPRIGQKSVIARGAFGSFFVSVNGQPGIKMRRVE